MSNPPLDDLARFNQERWADLVRAGIVFSRPMLDLDQVSARALVDPHGVMMPVAGRDVLCLASGGGQQSAAFALLQANVTVLDLTPEQLAQDRRVAEHYNKEIRIVQGDMRDLSIFSDNSFDLVWHAHSINFIPSVGTVFAEVARVLRPEGQYRVEAMNPFYADVDERDWTGEGYAVRRIYADGELPFHHGSAWDVEDEEGTLRKVEGPREFCHTLSTLTTGLTVTGFVIDGIWEVETEATDPEPGTWDHFMKVAPPWFTFWCRWRGANR